MIQVIPCLQDNYAYVIPLKQNEVCIIDPSEAGPILNALAGRQVVAILNTHHHHDHVGGNSALVEKFPHVLIYGHQSELTDLHRIPKQNRGVIDDQVIHLGDFRVKVLHVPGHTLSAVVYYFIELQAIFTGDTLFAAGCGRMFEGTPAQMLQSLQKINQLPTSTKIYSGHEYLAKNLEFARRIDPYNFDIRERQNNLASKNQPSVASLLSDERATNPFLRTASPEVRQSMAKRPTVFGDILDDVETFARLRRWKDEWSAAKIPPLDQKLRW